MTTEAIARLNDHNWTARKFVSFIEETYGTIEYAMETISPESLSITFVSNNSLVIASTKIGDAAVLEVDSQEYPLKNVIKISTQYEPTNIHPDDPIEMEIIRIAFKLHFTSGEELSFDYREVNRPVRVKTADSKELFRQIRNVIQSFI